MLEVYVVCRQAIFWLTTHCQQPNNKLKNAKFHGTFAFYQWILIFSKHTSESLSTASIHRYIFVFLTSYGKIVQTASLQKNLFLYILYQSDNFDRINAKRIIVLWKITPDESISYVFRKELYFFLPIFRFPWLTDVDLSSTNWLNCYSINVLSRLSSNDLAIMIVAVTYISFLPSKCEIC